MLMKWTFESRLEAIEWIAERAEDEGQFEVLREQLNYNYIYFKSFFIEIQGGQTPEVILLGKDKGK